MRTSLTMALAVTLAGMTALAATVPTGASEPSKAPRARERLICTKDPATGSHIKRRTCVTESEHKERQRKDQERLSRAQNRDFKTNVER